MFTSKITIICLAICTIKGAHLPQPFGGGGGAVGGEVGGAGVKVGGVLLQGWRWRPLPEFNR